MKIFITLLFAILAAMTPGVFATASTGGFKSIGFGSVGTGGTNSEDIGASWGFGSSVVRQTVSEFQARGGASHSLIELNLALLQLAAATNFAQGVGLNNFQVSLLVRDLWSDEDYLIVNCASTTATLSSTSASFSVNPLPGCVAQSSKHLPCDRVTDCSNLFANNKRIDMQILLASTTLTYSILANWIALDAGTSMSLVVQGSYRLDFTQGGPVTYKPF